MVGQNMTRSMMVLCLEGTIAMLALREEVRHVFDEQVYAESCVIWQP
jgi:hypothetical protein